MQAANDEEGVVGQRTWAPKGQGLEQPWLWHVYIQSISRLASGPNEIAKPQVSINSNNSSCNYKNYNRK